LEQHIVDAIAQELIMQRDFLAQRNVNLAIELAELKAKHAALSPPPEPPPLVPAGKGNGTDHDLAHGTPAGAA